MKRRVIVHNHFPKTRDAEWHSGNMTGMTKEQAQYILKTLPKPRNDHEKMVYGKLKVIAEGGRDSRDGENFNVTGKMRKGGESVSNSISLAAQNVEMAKTAAMAWWRNKGFTDISVTKAETA